MDNSNKNNYTELDLRYMGRIGQLRIYFGKLLRMFVYQSDWIAIPMAALIAGLVAVALGKDFGVTKEGTLMGIFALVCVCLWNGTFNSIQIIVRERDVIKREHRSGMHITSYIAAHMLYQAIICFLQCVITLFTATIVGMKVSGEGMITPFLIIDVGITMFFATYAADMLALFISSVVHSTTVAMTTMPFILIFQMVFSGGLFPLPEKLSIINNITISAPAFECMASQMNVDNLPYGAVDRMFEAVDTVEMDVTIDGKEILDMLSDKNNESMKELRGIKVGGSITAQEACNMLLYDSNFSELRNKPFIKRITIGSALDELATNNDATFEQIRDVTVGGSVSARSLIETLLTNPGFEKLRNTQLVQGVNIGELLSFIINIGNNFPEVNEELNRQVSGTINLGDVINLIRTNDKFQFLYDITLIDDTSVGEALRILMNTNSLRSSLNTELSYYTTVGEVIDYLNNSKEGDQFRNTSIVYHAKGADLINKVGKDKLKDMIEDKVIPEQMNGNYEHSIRKIIGNWIHILIIIMVFSVSAIIALEFIDKDKR